jgi:hypothetical protein
MRPQRRHRQSRGTNETGCLLVLPQAGQFEAFGFVIGYPSM